MANAALGKRRSLLVWLDEEMALHAPDEGRPGRPPAFSNAAIQFCRAIKVRFKLPLRQTAGMVASLLQLAGLFTRAGRLLPAGEIAEAAVEDEVIHEPAFVAPSSAPEIDLDPVFLQIGAVGQEQPARGDGTGRPRLAPIRRPLPVGDLARFHPRLAEDAGQLRQQVQPARASSAADIASRLRAAARSVFMTSIMSAMLAAEVPWSRMDWT